MANSSQISWALGKAMDSDRQLHYELAENYYAGEHRLAFATERYREAFGGLFAALSDNICPSVIDVQTERLEVVGFTSDRATTKVVTVGSTSYADKRDPLGDKAWDLWEANAMDIRSEEVHRDALSTGNGYVLVWPGEEGGAELWPQNPANMEVLYSTESPGVIEMAAKFWIDEGGYLRLTLYFKDKVEKYRSVKEVKSYTGQSQSIKPDDMQKFAPDVANEWGIVPVFHFANKVVNKPGISELKNVIPIQDALNKTIADMLIAMEFQSFRQRWITGMEIEVDDSGRPQRDPFGSGADRIIAIANESAKLGSFESTEINPFLNVADNFRAEAARVSGIPTHYLFVQGTTTPPSGEALKTAELRFTRKMTRTQSRFGKIWEQAIALGLFMNGDIAASKWGKFDLNTVWLPASARSDNENIDWLIKKGMLGVPNSQLLYELGYDPAQVKQFAEERAANAPVVNPGDTPPEDDQPDPQTDNLNN